MRIAHGSARPFPGNPGFPPPTLYLPERSSGRPQSPASRRTRSDRMNIERERGISVVTPVMTFEHADCIFHLFESSGW